MSDASVITSLSVTVSPSALTNVKGPPRFSLPPNTLLLRHDAKRSLLFCENSQYWDVTSQIADSKLKVIMAADIAIFFNTAFPDLLVDCKCNYHSGGGEQVNFP